MCSEQISVVYLLLFLILTICLWFVHICVWTIEEDILKCLYYYSNLQNHAFIAELQ